MTVSTTDSSVEIAGNGATVSFPYAFKVLLPTDLQVSIVTDATQVIALQSTSAYTVVQNSNLIGGAVVFNVAPLAGTTVSLVRTVPYTQTTDITNQGEFFPETHELTWDKIVMMAQQLARLSGRNLSKPALGGTSWDAQLSRLINLSPATTPNDAVNYQQMLAAIVASAAPALALPYGASLVNFLQTGVGAVTRDLQDKLYDTKSVMDYMTTSQKASVRAGDRAVDVTAALQAACNTGASMIRIPAGGYQVSGTITLAANQTLMGDGRKINGGTIIYAGAGQNVPVFKISAGAGEIKNISILGSSTSAATSGQKLIYINNTSSCTVQECYFNGGYDAIFMDGSSFYTSIYDCIFDVNFHCQLLINSVTSPGCDLMVDRCRFLGMTASGFACFYAFGLGSLQMSNTAFTLNQVSGGSMYLDVPAPLFGGAIFNNVVFENGNTTTAPAVYVKGTSAAKWNTLHFTGCFMTGGAGIGMRMQFVNGLYATNCTFSSTSTNGNLYFEASAQTSETSFVNCDFEGNAGITPVQCGASALISANFTNSRWTGSAAMIDFTGTTAASIAFLNVIGGNFGTAAQPILLPTPASVKGTILTNSPWLTYTPVVTAVTGAITSYSSTGSYQKIGKVLHFRISVAIITNGSGSGAINITLPRNAGETSTASGKGTQISGKALCCAVTGGSNALRVGNYDGGYPAVDGEILTISGTFQTD